jgi:putative addiction module CopG family antidote
MDVSIHPALQPFIDSLVQSGRYESAEAVVTTALYRFQGEDELPGAEVAEFRDDLAASIAQADRGETTEWDLDELWARVQRFVDR